MKSDYQVCFPILVLQLLLELDRGLAVFLLNLRHGFSVGLASALHGRARHPLFDLDQF